MVVTKVLASTAEDDTGPIQLTAGELSEATAFAASLVPGLQVSWDAPERDTLVFLVISLTPTSPSPRTP